MTSFFGIKAAVFAFFLNNKMDLRQIFPRFKRKHLFITTSIEKQCTRPLRECLHQTKQRKAKWCNAKFV